DVETERSVILDEIAMREDDPGDALAEAFAHRLFAGHPVGDPVSGTTRSVKGLTRAQIHGYYRRRYDASCMVVAVAGGVSHRDVVRWVREAFGDRLGSDSLPMAPRPGPGFALVKPSVGLLTRDTEQAQLTLGVPALRRHHPDRYSLALLSAALGGGMSSRLFQRIREEHGLAYTCFSGASAYADTGSWSLYTACQPSNLGTVADLISRELVAVAADGITADELELAQGQLCGATVLGLEDTESRMNRIGRRALTSGRHVSLDVELSAIRRVTLDDVTSIARRLLSRPMTAVVSGPFDRIRDLPDEVRTMARRAQWVG
ncbi:MAG: pitrilysin family protein, partial [Nakamurella sp.]